MNEVDFVVEYLRFDAKQAAAVAQEYEAIASQIGMILIIESHEDIEETFKNTAESWSRIAKEMKERGL